MTMPENKNSFRDRIIKTLTDNGFPEKRVTLPLEKMYQAAEDKNINFNDVLTELENEGIGHEKSSEKILFYSLDPINLEDEEDGEEEGENRGNGPDMEALYGNLFERLKGMDPKTMAKNPQQILEQMTPEDLEAIQRFYQNLSPTDRDQLMKKAKDMGIS